MKQKRNDRLKTRPTLPYSSIFAKNSIHYFGIPTQCPIKRSGWKMKMPLFLQAAPGMSLEKGIWCPVQALGTIKCSKSENSSVFPQISPCSFLECWWKKERDTERPCRIRPLGVTVLSRIRPAPLTQTLTHCNKMVSRWGIYCSRMLGIALLWRHREGLVLHWVSLSSGGWLMAEATTLKLFTKFLTQMSQQTPTLPEFVWTQFFYYPKTVSFLLLFFFLQMPTTARVPKSK